MLAHKNRLRSSKDFRRVYDNGRTCGTALLALRALKRGDPGPVRVGIVVTTRFSKKAVERNAVRRRLREALRRSTIMALGGADVVVTVRPAVRNATLDQLVAECNNCANRIAATLGR